jgi:hypothetical protein
MATPEELLNLRLLIAEPDETTYSEALLNSRIDTAGGNLNQVAYDTWTEKAASYAAMADISEGGSSRSNGSLHAKALQMVKLFKAKLDEAGENVPGPARGFIINRLVR